MRTEHDSMGEMLVPGDALYGAQTHRAVENFRIGGLRFQRRLVSAMSLLNIVAAHANGRTPFLKISGEMK